MIIGTPGNSLALRPMFGFYSEFIPRNFSNDYPYVENIYPFFNIDKTFFYGSNVFNKIDTIYPTGVYHSLSGSQPIKIDITTGISPVYGLPNKTLNLDLIWRNVFFTNDSGNIKSVGYNYFNNNESYLFQVFSGILPLRVVTQNNDQSFYTSEQKQNTPIVYNVLASFHNHRSIYGESKEQREMYPSGYITGPLMLFSSGQNGSIKHINYKSTFNQYLFSQDQQYYREDLNNFKSNGLHPHNLNFKKYLCENMYAELDLYIDNSGVFKLHDDEMWAKYLSPTNPAIEYLYIYSGLPLNSPTRNLYPSGLYYDNIPFTNEFQSNSYNPSFISISKSGNFYKIPDNYKDLVTLDKVANTPESKLIITLVIDGFPYTAEFLLKSDNEFSPLNLKVKNKYNESIYNNYVFSNSINHVDLADNSLRPRYLPLIVENVNLVSNNTNLLDYTSNYFVLNRYWKGTRNNIIENHVDLPKLGWKKCEIYLDANPQVRKTYSSLISIGNYFGLENSNYPLSRTPLFIASQEFEDPVGYTERLYKQEITNNEILFFDRIGAKTGGKIFIDNGVIFNINYENIIRGDNISNPISLSIIDSNNDSLAGINYDNSNYIIVDSQIDYRDTPEFIYNAIFINGNTYAEANLNQGKFNSSFAIECLKYKINHNLPIIKLGYYLCEVTRTVIWLFNSSGDIIDFSTFENSNPSSYVELPLEIQDLEIIPIFTSLAQRQTIKIIKDSLIDYYAISSFTTNTVNEGNQRIQTTIYQNQPSYSCLYRNYEINIPGLSIWSFYLPETYNDLVSNGNGALVQRVYCALVVNY